MCKAKTSKGVRCAIKCKGDYCHIHRGSTQKGGQTKTKDAPHRSVEKKVCESRHYTKDTNPSVESIEIQIMKECPVCLENKPIIELSCGHWLDDECASHMTDERCPICRAKMDLPRHILKKIARNKEKRKEEELEDETNELINSLPLFLRNEISVYQSSLYELSDTATSSVRVSNDGETSYSGTGVWFIRLL